MELSSSAGVFVALGQSVAGVVPRKGNIPNASKKHEGIITRAWVDFRDACISDTPK